MDAARAELTADEFVAAASNGPWPAFQNNGSVEASAETFLRGIYEDASPDELIDLSFKDLAALAHDFWRWRGERAPDQQIMRIRRGVGADKQLLDRDILEIAGPDMPFLVDSIMGEVAANGIATLALFHPLAPASRGAGRP